MDASGSPIAVPVFAATVFNAHTVPDSDVCDLRVGCRVRPPTAPNADAACWKMIVGVARNRPAIPADA